MVRPRSATLASSLALFVTLIGVSTENLQQTSNSQPGRDDSAPDVFINSWAVKIRGGPDDADAVASRYGFHNLGLVQGFDDVYKFRLGGREMQKVRSDSPYTSSIASDKLVEFAEQQFRRQVVTKSYVPPEDSILKEQWNLLNTGQYGDRYKGNDSRVVPAWLQGYTGCNVTVTVVDDGIDFRHPALWPNFAPMVSYDHHDNDSDPSTYDHEHGTSVSGIVGAAKNSTCAVGIAYECNLGSVRLLNGNRDMRTDVEEATALSHEQNIVDVYTNSWGPSDTGNIVMGPRTLTKLTLEKGISEGRNGKGSIFVWASGNGRDEDDCAADGYVSSIYTIAVGAIGVDSNYSFFDERCSGKMVVAYVTNPQKHSAIRTTSPGGNCRPNFGGTSAAAPQVSGAIALALEANPNLTWRDVQYLIAYTANPHLTSGHLTRNGAGLAVSRQYGFGVMDAEAMVTRARHWINVPSRVEDNIISVSRQQIPNVTHSGTVNYTGHIQYLEHVVVCISVTVSRNHNRGDLEIELMSPSGTLSVLLQPRRTFDHLPGEKGYSDWPFMSVMFWGEDPSGEWTLNIKTRNDSNGAVVSKVEFEFYGVSQVPEAVANIPVQCHSDCRRGCAREGPNFCDSCYHLRNSYTLECINECPPGYTERNDYCYDASLPVKECNSPLKSKEGTGFTPEYKPITCDEAGFTECCTNGNCVSAKFHFFRCFCDALCHQFNDCCDDAELIGCLPENVKPTLSYIDFGVTAGVETHSVHTDHQPIDVSFPFGNSLESRVYVLNNGSFVFTHNITSMDEHTKAVAPFQSANDPDSGTITYEVHEGNNSQPILSLVDSIISKHENTSFSSKWLLVTSWIDFQQPGFNFTNTFQGILVTDFITSYAVFTYKDGDMSFSDPGIIGFTNTELGFSVTHGATYREQPYLISGLNDPIAWVNVVYKISQSVDECVMNNGGCEQICTDTFLSYNCSCEDGYLLNGDETCSDIDECLGQDHGCEDICVNTEGSFFCNCSDGFLLNIDGKGCTDINECLDPDHGCEYSCENTVGYYTCGCDVGFELNTDGRTCRETLIFTLLLSMEDTGHETHVVSRVDDGISDPILVTDGFPLGCSRLSTIYVGTNGYFTFGRFTGFTPFPFSEGNRLSLVAPFFTDIDISKGSGRIVYQVHNNFSDLYSSQVAQYINVAINTNFSAEWILIATWTEVSPHNTNTVKATFFGILATDYQRSFAVFIYNCENGNANFSNRATVGFVTSDGFHENHEASYRWNPYPTLCRNYPTSQWAQIIYEISAPAGDDPTRCIPYTEY